MTTPEQAPPRTSSRHGGRPWWNRADATATELRSIADPHIEALDAEGRVELAAIWQERGGSELRVGGGFAAITAQLIEHGATDAVLKIVSRAVRDEVRHAEIAVDLAGRYRGGEPLWPGPQPVHVPLFAPAEGRFRATLLVVAMCCINETLACAVLEGQLALAKSVLTRAGLQSVLADEIDHARAGWAHLASPHVTAEMKAEMGEWLPRLLKSRLSDLVDEDTPFPGERYPDHGILGRRPRKEIVRIALEDVVLPGFAQAGIDPTKAAAWVKSAFAAREAR